MTASGASRRGVSVGTSGAMFGLDVIVAASAVFLAHDADELLDAAVVGDNGALGECSKSI